MTADLSQAPELLRQARFVTDEADAAIAALDYSKAVEHLRRLEEIAVHTRYVVLAGR